MVGKTGRTPPKRVSSNTTKKGTKQRSLNLDDETFGIIERAAIDLHVHTNSAALSLILHRWAWANDDHLRAAYAGPPRTEPAKAPGVAKDYQPKPTTPPAQGVLPDARQESFPVASDPGNGWRSGPKPPAPTDDEED
jgi:hypothetical protein